MHIVYIPLNKLSFDTSVLQFKSRMRHKHDNLRQSIVSNGLLNPLRVTPHKKGFSILDGKKRLQVLKTLAKSGYTGQILTKIPCVIDNLFPKAVSEVVEADRPALLKDAELAHLILSHVRKSMPLPYIAQTFDCDISVVESCIKLPRLHAKVLKAFYDGTISLEQAAALATLSNPKAQWNLLLQLGPFVSDTKVLQAIRAGETVIDLPDGEIVILPSRAPSHSEFDSSTQVRFSTKTVAA